MHEIFFFKILPVSRPSRATLPIADAYNTHNVGPGSLRLGPGRVGRLAMQIRTIRCVASPARWLLRSSSSVPHAPCIRLNLLRPRSTSSGAKPDDITQRASSFNKRTKVRKAWCLCPGTHHENDSAKSRHSTRTGPRNRPALPLLLTEATPYLRCMNTWCAFVRPVDDWRHGVHLVPTCSAWQEGVTTHKAFAVEFNTQRGTRFRPCPDESNPPPACARRWVPA
jgi:hypothetical protein